MNDERGYNAQAQEEVVVDQNSQELVEQLEQPLQEAQSEAKPAKKDAIAERNFRELREKAERLERELERERRDKLQQQYEAQARLQPKVEEADPELDFNIGDDDLADGKALKKLKKAYEYKTKKLERDLEDFKKQQREFTTETLLKSRYSDFDTVVNDATITKLRERYPEVAMSLHTQPDPYAKLSAAYSLIKDLGLYDSNSDQYEQDKAVIARNVKQPRSAGTMAPQQGTTPLQQANAYAQRYSDSMEKKIRSEIEDIIKR